MKFYSFSTSENPTKAVIALHGYTGDINSMKPIAKMLNLKKTKWLIPEAPYKSPKKGYSWYYRDDKEKWKFKDSIKTISKVVQSAERGGFPKKKIYILGFSQGASITLEFLIRQNFSLGGIIPIAGFCTFKKKSKDKFSESNKKTRVLLIHGQNDEIVFPSESKKSYRILKSHDYLVSIKLFPTCHKIPLKARQIIQKFIYG